MTGYSVGEGWPDGHFSLYFQAPFNADAHYAQTRLKSAAWLSNTHYCRLSPQPQKNLVRADCVPLCLPNHCSEGVGKKVQFNCDNPASLSGLPVGKSLVYPRRYHSTKTAASRAIRHWTTHCNMAPRGKGGEEVACLAPSSGLRKVNSETNFAVSLLLAVGGNVGAGRRDATINRPSTNGVRRLDEQSEHSTGSTIIASDSNTASRRQSESPPQAVAPQQRQQHQESSPVVQPRSPRLSMPRLPSSPTLSRSRVTASHGDGELFKYSYEERQAALRRFREKKRRRQFQKTVRYMVRKRLAETRPRYKGRFSKPQAAPSLEVEVPEVSEELSAKEGSEKKEIEDCNK